MVCLSDITHGRGQQEEAPGDTWDSLKNSNQPKRGRVSLNSCQAQREAPLAAKSISQIEPFLSLTWSNPPNPNQEGAREPSKEV